MVKNKEYWVEYKGLFVSNTGRIKKFGRGLDKDGAVIYVGGETISRTAFISRAMLGSPVGKYCKLIYFDGDESNLSADNIMYKVPFKTYRGIVDSMTKKLPLHKLKDIEKRKFYSWDLDHIISCKFGWENNMNPKDIACMENLQMLTHKENQEKGMGMYCVIEQCRHLYTTEGGLHEEK